MELECGTRCQGVVDEIQWERDLGAPLEAQQLRAELPLDGVGVRGARERGSVDRLCLPQQRLGLVPVVLLTAGSCVRGVLAVGDERQPVVRLEIRSHLVPFPHQSDRRGPGLCAFEASRKRSDLG
jgi:hypothetical protein